MFFYIIGAWLFILSIIVYSNYKVATKAAQPTKAVQPERYVDKVCPDQLVLGAPGLINKVKETQEAVEEQIEYDEDDKYDLQLGELYPHYRNTSSCPFCGWANFIQVEVRRDPVLHAYCKCQGPTKAFGCGYEWTVDVGESSLFSTEIHKNIKALKAEVNSLKKKLSDKEKENEALAKRIKVFEKPIYREATNYRVAPESDVDIRNCPDCGAIRRPGTTICWDCRTEIAYELLDLEFERPPPSEVQKVRW